MNLLAVKIFCLAFCSKVSTLNLASYELQFSYCDDFALITLTQKTEIAVALAVTDNTVRIVKDKFMPMDCSFPFTDFWGLYKTLISLLNKSCNISISKILAVSLSSDLIMKSFS